MKKSLLILSALAMAAAPAVYADTLEAGTAESPKYYVIKACRGIPYVTYTSEAMNASGAQTTLCQANELSEAAIWAVVPGTEDGTVNIYNYTTRDDENKAYMFSFITTDGSEFAGALGAVATTGDAQDVYVKDNGNGTYGLALKNQQGKYDDGYYALDASSSSQFMGNWVNQNDGGTRWKFYTADISNGVEAALADVQQAVNEDAMRAMVNEYIGYFQDYKNAVSFVAAELQAGIDALNKLEYSDDYSTQIENIWATYTNSASNKLNTMFAGKTVALNNLRKYNAGVGSYLCIKDEGNGYVGVASYDANEKAVFVLESTTYNDAAAYYLYNAASETYFGADKAPVTSKDEACTINFVLQTGRDGKGANPIVGFNIIANGVSGNKAFNLNNANPPGLDYWKASGEDSSGSIWSLVDILDDAISSVTSALEPYVSNVPAEVADILNAAIDEANALEYSQDVAAKANDIRTKALADANAALRPALTNKYWALKNLRNGYVKANASNEFTIGGADTADNVYEVMTAEDGGFILYSPSAKKYISRGSGSMEITDEQANAQKVYPVLNHFINTKDNQYFYGISFPFTDSSADGTLGLNTNAKGMYAYRINDGGSIFAVAEVDVQGKLDEAINSVKTALEPYVPNVPTEVAAVLQKAIDNASELEYNAQLAANAEALRTNAITEANALLSTGLNEKVYTLKNLRRAGSDYNSYIAVNMGQDKYLPVASAYDFNAQFTFESADNGGYTIYNSTTKTYIGQKESQTEQEGADGETTIVATSWYGPVENADAAVKVYPVLNSSSGFYGVAFPFSSNKTGKGFNTNSWQDNGSTAGELTSWSINDGGSIWAVAKVDVQAAIDDAVQSVTSALEPYIPNVPTEVAAVLQKAIDDASELEYNSQLAANAEALRTKAIADGTAELQEVMNLKAWTLRGLRNGYIVPDAAGEFMDVSSTDAPECCYGFYKEEDGGYYIYSASEKKYFGPGVVQGTSGTRINLVANMSEAQRFYPVLNSNGDYYGVSFPVASNYNQSTRGLHANVNGLFSWAIGDPGSIFAVSDNDVPVAIEEVEAAEAGSEVVYDLQGRRVNGNAKGLLIVNGRKVFVK